MLSACTARPAVHTALTCRPHHLQYMQRWLLRRCPPAHQSGYQEPADRRAYSETRLTLNHNLQARGFFRFQEQAAGKYIHSLASSNPPPGQRHPPCTAAAWLYIAPGAAWHVYQTPDHGTRPAMRPIAIQTPATAFDDSFLARPKLSDRIAGAPMRTLFC